MSLSRRFFAVVPVILLSCAAGLRADGPFSGGSDADCDLPSGSRQRCIAGKSWPLAPRPVGKSESFVSRYHTAHYWPDPYRWEDRGNVRAQLAAQRSQGWITTTTLYDQHFNPETHEINLAGKTQLRWILLHAPAAHRLPWVAAGVTAQASQSRLASAQQEASLIAGPDCPPLMLRVCLPTGTAAQEVDLVRRTFLSTMPSPRLPITSPGGSSGSSTPAPQSPAPAPGTGGPSPSFGNVEGFYGDQNAAPTVDGFYGNRNASSKPIRTP